MKLRAQSSSQNGFSLVELLVVVVIILVVLGVSLPNILAAMQNIKLKSGAQEVSDFYQQGRMRAVQDDHYYQVVSATVGGSTGLIVDLNGNGNVDAGEPAIQLPQSVTLTNSGAPAGLDSTKLGFNPIITTESTATYAADGNQRAGLQWDARGLPCQRNSATSPCAPGIGWLQNVKYQASNGQIAWAAVSVSPAGRAKIWVYDASGGWR